MELTAANVHEVVRRCLFTPEEIKKGAVPDDAILAYGVVAKMGFHPERLEAARGDVLALLTQLPENFMKSSKSGGWSFLKACDTRAGNQWGQHRDIDDLLTIGLALHVVEFLMPREAWSALPGGMPYFVVLDQPEVQHETQQVSAG